MLCPVAFTNPSPVATCKGGVWVFMARQGEGIIHGNPTSMEKLPARTAACRAALASARVRVASGGEPGWPGSPGATRVNTRWNWPSPGRATTCRRGWLTHLYVPHPQGGDERHTGDLDPGEPLHLLVGRDVVHSPPPHLDEQVHLVGILKACGDVVVLEVKQLLGEAVDVGGDPGGGVVVLGGGVLHDAGGHQPPILPVLLV